jgi:2-dehydropantoate 2-reductase
MDIAVIGAGAIGGLVAGYLKLKGEDVSLVGHADSVKAIKEKGLHISGIRGNFNIVIDISDKLDYRPKLVILATKTQDVERALEHNLRFMKNSKILTTQNGIKADYLVSKYISKENIVSSIVMFGATYLEPAKVIHNFEGSWIIGKIFGKNNEQTIKISEILNKIFPTKVNEDIKGMKYLKIFVNANNCIPAILGLSMQEAFLDVNISRISIAIWKEGLEIVHKAGISLSSLPDFPLERLMKLTSMPIEEAAKIFSGIMINLSKEPLYGSILQSIKRGRTSEIDYINGEFVNLAKTYNARAPLNEKFVELVHRVEKTNNFFTKEELLNNTKGLLSAFA